MCFSNQFMSFLNESHFIAELFSQGYEEIGKANYATSGKYYLAFTALSTGIERIQKLIIILDQLLETGTPPTNNYIKDNYGHKIILLYEKVKEIKERRELQLEFLDNLDEIIYQNILNILSQFAQRDRYYNIDSLISTARTDDAKKTWYETVDVILYEQRVSRKRKEKIQFDAMMVNSFISDFTMVHHIQEDGTPLDNVLDASRATGIFEVTSPYRRLSVYQIMRYFVEIITNLGELPSSLDSVQREIPYFSEIFRIFFNDDKYIINRKNLHI